jgi:hypothetical protein
MSLQIGLTESTNGVTIISLSITSFHALARGQRNIREKYPPDIRSVPGTGWIEEVL